MKITAVICELNPVTNGHAYLFGRARELTNCDAVLAVLSGNFVQRAEAAVFEARTRARAALLCGADACIELPALYATAAGERFAEGAINIITAIPAITHLAFGSESGNLDFIQAAARAQLTESDTFKAVLNRLLKEGKPYPAALSAATAADMPPSLFPASRSFNAPNDILAVEYCKRLLKTNAPITPLAIKRVGAGYHDKTGLWGGFYSAAAVREMIAKGDYNAVKKAVPTAAYPVFKSELDRQEDGALRGRTNALELLTVHALRTKDISLCPDAGGEGLDIKLKKAALNLTDLTRIVAAAKSKRYTQARIRRLCLQALLGITHYPDVSNFKIPAKLLGVKETLKNEFLTVLPKNIIVKNTDASRYTAALHPQSQAAADMIWQLNKDAAALYALIAKPTANTTARTRC